MVFWAMGSKLQISFLFNEYLDLAMIFSGDLLFQLLHGVVLLSLHKIVIVICCDGIRSSGGEVFLIVSSMANPPFLDFRANL